MFGKVVEGMAILQRIGEFGSRAIQTWPCCIRVPGSGQLYFMLLGTTLLPLLSLLLLADDEVATADGTPKVDVTIAACGVGVL